MPPFFLIVAFAGVLGASLGSFCNVLVIRLKEGRSIGGRSACAACQRLLSPRDLVPVISWVALRGKCRTCKEPLHPQYPLVECAGVFVGIFTVLRHATPYGVDVMGALFTATFLFFLLVVTTFDLRWQLVPTMFTLGGALLFAVWQMVVMQSPLPVLLGAVTAGGLLAVFVWASRGRMMGEGDPLVGIAIGAVLLWPLGLVSVGVSFIVGGLVAGFLLAFGLVSRKTPVPFVPFLAFGALLVYAWHVQALFFVKYVFG